MRVLHSVRTFLSLSENWIYPQVAHVPGVEGRVFCWTVENLGLFYLNGSSLILYPPPWKRALGIPRFLNATGRRLGCGGKLTALRIRCWHPQIIHAHFGTRACESLALKRTLKVPLVTSFYGWDAWYVPKAQPEWERRYRELFAEGETFLVEGPAMQQRLCELGCPGGKVRIQRIGVDLWALPFQIRDFSGTLKIAMMGRFVEKKGLVNGLQACALAAARGADLSVTIIGDATPDDSVGLAIRHDLQVLANQPSLSGRVRFAGFVPLEEARALLGAHHVFLCPSKHPASGDAEGGSPVALTEAMASGLLCIGTRHCDIPEVIIDGKTGLLCSEGNVREMADILCRLGSERGRLTGLTKAGRLHVEDNFSLSNQMHKLRAIYDSLSPN